MAVPSCFVVFLLPGKKTTRRIPAASITKVREVIIFFFISKILSYKMNFFYHLSYYFNNVTKK